MSCVVRCFDATGGLRHERNLCGKTENKQVPRRSDKGKTPTISVTFDIGVLIPYAGGNGGMIDSLAAAGLLILISWVMDTGRALREENELTV